MKPTTYQMRKIATGDLCRAGSLDHRQSLDDAAQYFAETLKATVTPSGAVEFVNSAGITVAVYLRLDAAQTAVGQAALREYRETMRRKAAEQEAKEAELEALLRGMSTEEALARLRGA